MAATMRLQGAANVKITEGLIAVLQRDRPERLPAVLASYREHGLVSSQSESALGGLIVQGSGSVGVCVCRFSGLCLLAVLVSDGSTDLFQQHCLPWLRSLEQTIQSQDPLPTVELAVCVLRDLLQYSSQLPELAREIGLNSIPGILTSLLGLKPECHLAAMEGMRACMSFYPTACGSLRGKLGAYFLSKLDSDSPKLQEMACSCYALLPSLGSGFTQGSRGHTEAWTQQLHCLLHTAHSILGQLYEGAETDPVQYEGPGGELPFPSLSERDPLLVLQLRQRYSGVSQTLSALLSSDVSVPVRLPVQSVLNLVCRALAVTPKNIGWLGDGPLKALVLPSVHSHSLHILSALIHTAGARLVQFSSALCRLFAQTLSAWSPACDTTLPGQQRVYSAVRVQLYNTLELWVKVGGASSGVLQGTYHHADVLLAHLIGDITTGADTVKLRAGRSSPELAVHAGKAGGRRSKGADLSEVGMQLQRKHDAGANQDTALSAVTALSHIVLTSGTLLKEEIHKKLQELLIPLLVRLQQEGFMRGLGGQLTSPYSSPPARQALYHLLLSLVLAPSPQHPPPLHCGVRLFSQGLGDPSVEVSSFCRDSLTVCNSLLHPRSPSLSLPDPLPQTQSLRSQTGVPFPSARARTLPSLLPQNHLPSEPLPGEGEAGGEGGRRPVFVRYDKEDPEDVEISLESDSDDSVVIMPEGLPGQNPKPAAPAPAVQIQRPQAGRRTGHQPQPVLEPGASPKSSQAGSNRTGSCSTAGNDTDSNITAAAASSPGEGGAPVVTTVTSEPPPLPPLSVVGGAGAAAMGQVAVESHQQLQLQQNLPQQNSQSQQQDAVININSSDEEEDEDLEEEEEDPEGEGYYEEDEDEEEYDDEEEDYEEEGMMEEEEEGMMEEEEGEMLDEDEEEGEFDALDDDEDDDIIDEDEMGEGVCLGVPGAVAVFALERIEEDEEEEERGDKGGPTALEEGKGDVMSSQQEGQGKQEALAKVREEAEGQGEEVPEQEGAGPEQQEVLVMSQGEVEENQEVIAAVSQIQLETPPQEVEMGQEGEGPGQLQEEEGAAGKLPEKVETPREEVSLPREGDEKGGVEMEGGEVIEPERDLEERGMKRKREEAAPAEEEGSLEKKPDSDSTAVMMAAFVDISPEEEEEECTELSLHS
ncbi:proline-, glutamic acid- and leucine-rich protein 1-like [Polyodon spathula]|uniref:proline-, glutamic acid- and leucine-rich protein 1-like n=1 Tax=Polyodon spathula TaxID=7913 RepID=UPI001B7F1F37|nr:proline-, glutamic acid- and leucine-rich protein 1-like [Polyodon spathula]